jgi:hypothetical protein
MKRIFLTVILAIATLGYVANAQTGRITNEKEIIDSLTTIDPEIIKYFPRWKICEPDLQIQIYQTFLFMGYSKNQLSEQNIEVLAAPREDERDPYELLMITCGTASMNAVQIEYYMGDKLVRFLTGEYIYQGKDRGYPADVARRDYCYTDIPIEYPLQASQAQVILDYIKQPTNVKQAFTVSLFEQSLKVGATGFWIRSIIGSDHIGYPFWSAGESKLILQRPLYVNNDYQTRQGIPFLINAYMGGGYRLTTGLGKNDLFSWVHERTLNAANGGKLIAGFDFHMPFHPALGVSFTAELPLKELTTIGIDRTTYGVYIPKHFDQINFADGDPRPDIATITAVAPILRSTGYLTVFYNWWLNKANPENYLRFDLGMNYSEVREAALYEYPNTTGGTNYEISVQNIVGLKTYKPKEFADWLFAKVEYRNQAIYPFGASLQYANQVLLGRVWLPLFNNWFYIEAKYATPLRSARPYEIKNFFMISPLLRITI